MVDTYNVHLYKVVLLFEKLYFDNASTANILNATIILLLLKIIEESTNDVFT